jgi:hypothetical protein
VLSLLGRLIGLAFLVLVLSPFLGPPVYLELAGASAAGTVVAKREVIQILTDTWMRRQFVDVRFQPGDAPDLETAEVAVDIGTYDRLRVGEPTQVRYLPNPTLRVLGPLATARLATQPPLASFVARIGNVLIGFGLAIAAWLALLWAWSKWRHWWLSAAIFLLMAGGTLYIGSNWPTPAPTEPLLAATATVRELDHITRVWAGKRTSGEDAVQPYTIVQLVFVPQGASEPVIAVDSIDTGSVPALEQGGEVAISYSAVDPRSARIDGATRTYFWKNLRSFGIIALILLAAIAIPWLIGRLRKSRRAGAAP